MKAPLDQRPVTELKGVGPALEVRLNALGLYSLQDVLFHLPLRYEDRTRITPIGRLVVGQPALIEGEVTGSRIDMGRRRSLWVGFRDDSGQVGLRFYAFSKALQQRFAKGARFRCYGDVRMGRTGFELYHPESEVCDDNPLPVAQTLTPIYPTADGLPQKRLRDLVAQTLALASADDLPDLLPSAAKASRNFGSLWQALNQLHHPVNPDPEARERLVLEELLAHHVSMLQAREVVQSSPAQACRVDPVTEARFMEALPFPLTAAQTRVVDDIRRDMARHYPMLRLIQGDVGSGKTLVAALAALTALSQEALRAQVAIMAPTEILAEQHLQVFREWFEPLGYPVDWVSGKVKGKARREALARIVSGYARIVVGTHALFQDDVCFDRLTLVVVDEQHRFGVHQRLSLQEKGQDADGRQPHQLIMTATPIPRTLAMSAYADLDTSVIDELPPGRSPVVTRVLSDSRRDEVMGRVSDLCREGAQAYWVCTLVEESETLQCQAAEVAAEQLAGALPELRVGLVHGRLSAPEKAAVMSDFAAGHIQLLVATTVIEVGVNVPNASLMVIENPERLGLAQLHQLRGRVGRGQTQSYCLLMYHSPLSRNARERLQVLRDTQDGFVIAEKDLALRGPGELLGTRQTGAALFHLADLEQDGHLLDEVRELGEQAVRRPDLCEALIQRWLGQRLRYAQV